MNAALPISACRERVFLTGYYLHPAAEVEHRGALTEEEQEHRANGQQRYYNGYTDEDCARPEGHAHDRRKVVQPADTLLAQFTCQQTIKFYRSHRFYYI